MKQTNFNYWGTRGVVLLYTILYASGSFDKLLIDVYKIDDFLRCPAGIHETKQVVYQLNPLFVKEKIIFKMDKNFHLPRKKPNSKYYLPF